MNELLAKLTDLGYEFFGILLPGFFSSIALVLWLIGIGYVDAYSALEFLGRLRLDRDMIWITLALVAWYFLGHTVHWVSRRGRATDLPPSTLRRTLLSLRFRIPKLDHTFDPDLQPLFERVRQRMSPPGGDLNWGQFYPLAKTLLAHNRSSSLAPTYQNKYTLHRSVVVIGAAVFWLSAMSLVAVRILPTSAKIMVLVALCISALIVVACFSASYLYNWKLFGNTLITESYAHFFVESLSDDARRK
jgi:hypothetical protein